MNGCSKIDRHYPAPAQPFLSRPSKIRSAADAAERIRKYMTRRYYWALGPSGFQMPLPSDYGLSLSAPSSDEVLRLVGGGP